MHFADGNPITDQSNYLEKMAKPLKEKLKIIRYIPKNAKTVLDVGCADGAVTIAMAELFPWINFLGVDLSGDFINKAKEKAKHLKNITFEKVYLRDLLAREDKYNVVVFCSVLHEFYTYGEGLSSVLKALADAHELLVDGGNIIIRDMILDGYTKRADFEDEELIGKIKVKKGLLTLVSSFEDKYGSLTNHHNINHFLLKYMYKDNWERELLENYVAVSFEQYEKIFDLLEMRVQYKESYLIEYLKNLWIKDFAISEEDIAPYKSTGILVAKKEVSRTY